MLAPQVGLEPTTLRLRLDLCFHIGADYLINFLSKVAGRYWGLIGLAPQPLVSARSCLHCKLNSQASSAGFAQGCRSNSRWSRFPMNSPSFSTTVACGSCNIRLQPDALPLSY